MDKEKTKKVNLNIKNVVKCYSEEIVSHIPGSRVMLYGSYAKGNFSKDSDIDIAVFLSSNFSNTDIVEVNRLLCKLSSNYNADIQTQVFMQDELITPMGIVEEIVEYGIDITYFENNKLLDFLSLIGVK
jgi:predicted nucleotidyltransferase